MPTIKIVKYKARRGTDAQRMSVVLNQGEIGYTTDTKRLFIGDGIGNGIVTGNKFVGVVSNVYNLSATNAQIGDFALANNQMYVLSGGPYTNLSNWIYGGTGFNQSYFQLDGSNLLSIKANSLTLDRLYSGALSGRGLSASGGVLGVNYEPTQFSIVANKLTLTSNALSSTSIDSTSLGNGLSGGSGVKIGLKVDGTSFGFDGSGALTLNTLSASSSWAGSGIYATGGKLNATVIGVDNKSLYSSGGVVSMATSFGGISSTSYELPHISVDGYGRVVSTDTSIYDGLSALSGIFAGYPGQTIDGFQPSLVTNVIYALSANGATSEVLALSSAGFLILASLSANTRSDGKPVGRFAIPIFSY